MAIKDYVNLNALRTFLDNLKTLFATKTEVNAKANTTLSSANTYTDDAVAQKSLVQFITWEDDD